MSPADLLLRAIAVAVEHLDAKVVAGWPPPGPLALCARCGEFSAARSPFGLAAHRDCGPALLARAREARLDAQLARPRLQEQERTWTPPFTASAAKAALDRLYAQAPGKWPTASPRHPRTSR